MATLSQGGMAAMQDNTNLMLNNNGLNIGLNWPELFQTGLNLSWRQSA